LSSNADQSEWISVREAELLCGLPKNRGYALIKGGHWPFAKRFGERGWRIHRASLLALPTQGSDQAPDGIPLTLVSKLRSELEVARSRNAELERQVNTLQSLLRSGLALIEEPAAQRASR
jgi:hypothetical protein